MAFTVLLLLIVLWAGQLLVLRQRLSTFDWDTYWATRRFYRPALIALGDWGEGVVPAKAFDPLSRDGATLGFTLAAGVYAATGAAGLTGLAAFALRALRCRR